MHKFLIASLLAGAAFLDQPAQAALSVTAYPCAASDIGLLASNSGFACTGFYTGNLASKSTSGDQTDALAILGLAFPDAFANSIEKIDFSGTNLDFSTLIAGVTYVGIHFGRVPNAPGPAAANNVTAFYRFDAGEGIDILKLAYASGSNATIYSTGATPPIPEPATWAMMIGGFALAGAMMRRRTVQNQFA